MHDNALKPFIDMKKLRLLVLLALLLATVGCEKEEEIPVKIFPGEGIDVVKIGDTKSKVMTALGETDVLNSSWFICYGTNCYTYSTDWVEYPALGITVYLNGDNQSVSSIFLEEPYDGLTKERIGIGSSKEKVEAAYGIVTPEEYSYGTYYDYESLGMEFEYDNADLVKEIYIYEPD